MKKLYSFLVIAIFIQSVFSQRVINLNSDNSVPIRMAAPSTIPKEILKDAKASRVFAINPALQSARSVSVNDIVTLQLFENETYNSRISNIVTDVNGTLALTMLLSDFPMGFAIIVTSPEGKSFINMSIPELGRSFGSRYSSESNNNYLLEIDENKREYAPMGNDVIEVPQGIQFNENGNIVPQHALQDLMLNCSHDPSLGVDDPATIDLLIVYTPAAANSEYSIGKGGINNVISSMIALGNLCLSNSQTGITLTLVHSAQVLYPETGDIFDSLIHLTNTSDGYMDEVHALREQYNADLVQLLSTETSAAGIAYGNLNVDGDIRFGFSVCDVRAAVDNYTSMHEIGHNMGLGHGAQQTTADEGIFPYSQGWRWQSDQTDGLGNPIYYTSIMSYGGSYYDDSFGYNYVRVPYFSNPNVYFGGGATGDAAQADAARSLREMKHVIAFYSDRVKNLPTPTNIIVSAPTDHGVTISWDACENAVLYCLICQIGDVWLYSGDLKNTTYTVNYSTWNLAACTEYEFFIWAINECDDFVHSPTLTFTTKCDITQEDIKEITHKLEIFPNPVKDEIFIESDSPIEKVELYSLAGNLLLSESKFSKKLSVSVLLPGVYMLKIYTNKGLTVGKVVKE